MGSTLRYILKDIKIKHSVFALPFALLSAFMAASGVPNGKTVGLIVVAMVFARSAAMAFNRVADRQFDRTNPRTLSWPLASGKASAASYLLFVGFCSALFVGTCYFINPLAFRLSPFALGVLFLYSYTKRFTCLSHFFLGLALGLAPVGAWIAVTGTVSSPPVILGVAVVFWLGGLDILYSTQDYHHDVSLGLHSIPKRFGLTRALQMARLSHAAMIGFLLLLGFRYPENAGWLYMAGVVIVAVLLWYEHSLVREDDLSRVNVAFFNMNGLISVGLMLFTLADRLMA